jgi:hypothetical protein
VQQEHDVEFGDNDVGFGGNDLGSLLYVNLGTGLHDIDGRVRFRTADGDFCSRDARNRALLTDSVI